MQLPPSRGMLNGLDRSDHMASGRNKRIDQCQLQRAVGARVGMRGGRGPLTVAGAWPGSSVQSDSYHGARSETISQLRDLSPDVQ